jgi:hypothetical protein
VPYGRMDRRGLEALGRRRVRSPLLPTPLRVGATRTKQLLFGES